MGRERGLSGILLILLLLASGCTDFKSGRESEIIISFRSGRPDSRAMSPDEDKISDVSLIVFDDKGAAEDCAYLENGNEPYSVRLVTGKGYTICACANFGYQVYADDIGELSGVRYHLAYPDEYRNGIPMFAQQKIFLGEDCREISVQLERLMAKVSLKVDRRRLSEDVELFVRSAKIGNCPRSAGVFRPDSTLEEDSFFPSGFVHSGSEVDNLNTTTPENGISKSISLYMLENIQTEDSDLCSYLEMTLDYMSDLYSSGSKGLVYRFYLGDGKGDRNVRRNYHYTVTVTPKDDGLSEDNWRVDKSDLSYTGPVSFRALPSDYIRGDIGEKIHIWCEFIPEDAPFDVGISYMEDDKAEGIYDYEIDSDGHGAVLTLTGSGRGLIYMHAGSPVNNSALFIIEVNQRQETDTGQ